MMGNPVGAEVAFSIGDEDSYGAGQATPDMIKVYVAGPPGLSSTQELETVENLGFTESAPLPGAHDAAGSLPVQFGPQYIGKLLKHLFGSLSSSGAGPYAHTFTIGAVPAYGLIAEIDNGANAPTGGRYELHKGVRPSALNLAWMGKTKPTLSFDLKGAGNAAHSDSVHDATVTDLGCTPFSIMELSVKEGGGAITHCTGGTAKFTRELDEDGIAAGGSGVRSQLDGGGVKAEGEITVFFNTLTELNKAINNTESSLEIILSRGDGLGSSGNESLSFLMPTVKYKRQSPTIPGPLGHRVTLSYIAYGGVTATLKNAVATP